MNPYANRRQRVRGRNRHLERERALERQMRHRQASKEELLKFPPDLRSLVGTPCWHRLSPGCWRIRCLWARYYEEGNVIHAQLDDEFRQRLEREP